MSKEPVDFEEVYRRFLGDVYRFCLSMTQDAQTAEELTQETFFKALNHFHLLKTYIHQMSLIGNWHCIFIPYYAY